MYSRESIRGDKIPALMKKTTQVSSMQSIDEQTVMRSTVSSHKNQSRQSAVSHSKSKKSPKNKKEVKFSRKKGNNDGGSPDAKPEGDHIITFIDFLSIAKDQFNAESFGGVKALKRNSEGFVSIHEFDKVK